MPQKYTGRPGSRRYTNQSSKLLEKCLYAVKAQKVSQQKTKILFYIPRRTITNELKC
jgi:hypothetical protein